jgi:histidine triad (HIT) family protein
MSACIFCDIAAKKAPASIVYEDDVVVAFMDLFPINPGHTLVVPKQHFARVTDVDDATAARMMAVARDIAAAIYRSPIRAEGVNLTLADGAAAGQEVPHAHLHVIPRFRGDGFRCTRAGGLRQASRAQLEEKAILLRKAME